MDRYINRIESIEYVWKGREELFFDFSHVCTLPLAQKRGVPGGVKGTRKYQ